MSNLTPKRISQALCMIDHGTRSCSSQVIQSYQSRLPEFSERPSGAIQFDWRGGHYHLFCAQQSCSLSRELPQSEKSLGEELFEAVVGIATFGLGCSSEHEAKVDVVATYTDDAESGDLQTQSKTADVKKGSFTDGKCFDSDGLDFQTPGKVVMYKGESQEKEYKDSCKDTAYLTEWTCKNGNQSQKVVICNQEIPGTACAYQDGMAACLPDADGDSIVDAQDNCPKDTNANQLDSDKDFIGDVCDIKQLSVDDCSYCKLYESGDSKCYGSVMCDGSSSWLQESMSILGLGIVKIVSMSRSYCALLNSGEIYCWGDLVKSKSPIKIDAIKDAQNLFCGLRRCYALVKGGDYFAWGDNSYLYVSALNLGSVSEPKKISGLSNVLQLAFGAEHACAVFLGGSFDCWGPAYTQTGGAADYAVIELYSKKAIQSIVNPLQVVAGWTHTCILENNHTVKCWGGNYYAQLGDGTLNSYGEPKMVPGLNGVQQLGAGIARTCALLVDGGVKCWGHIDKKNLPPGTPMIDTSAGLVVTTPTKILGVSNVKYIAAGTYNTCAYTQQNDVVCWH